MRLVAWSSGHGVLLALIVCIVLAITLPASAGEAKSKPISIAKVEHPTKVDFEKEVLPFLNTSCMACHNKTKAKAGLVLETPADIRKGGDDGAVVVPGKASASLLLRAAAHAPDVDSPMPPPNNKSAAPNLSPAQLGLLSLWIEQGATGEVHGSLGPIVWRTLAARLDPIYAVALSPDGRYAACGRANRIDIYDLALGRRCAQLSDPAIAHEQAIAHRAMVESLAFSPDSKLLASGSYREVKLWRRPEPVRLFTIGSEPAACVAVSPDGATVATGGDDGAIHLWSASDGKPAGGLVAADVPALNALCFSPDGARLIGASADGSLRLWNVNSKTLLSETDTPAEARQAMFLRDGKQIAVAGAHGVVRRFSLSEDKNPKLKPGKSVNASDGSVLNAKSPILALDIGPDETRIISVGDNSTIRLSNATNGKTLATLTDHRFADELAAAQRALEQAKAESAYRAAQVDSARKQASAAADRVKRAKDAMAGAVKDLATKQAALDQAASASKAAAAEMTAKQKSAADDLARAQAALQKAQAARAQIASESHRRSLDQQIEKAQSDLKQAQLAVDSAHSDDDQADAEKSLAAAEASLKSAQAAKQQDKDLRKKTEKDLLRAQDDVKRAQAAKAAAQSDAKPKTAQKAFDAAQEELKKAEALKAAADDEIKLSAKAATEAAAVLADAQSAASVAEQALQQRQSRVSTASAAARRPTGATRAAAFAPDGSRLATVGDDGAVRLWIAKSGAMTEAFRDAGGALVAVAFAGTNRVAICPASEPPEMWETRSAWPLASTIPAAGAPSPFADRVLSVDFDPTGKWLATGGGVPSRSGELRLLDLPSGHPILALDTLDSDTVQCVRFSPDGSRLATASTDHFVKILSVPAGKVLHVLEGHTGQALGVAWKHDGHVVASVGADNTLRFWNAETGERGKVVQGFDKEVAAVAWVGDADQALAASGEGKIRLVRENGSDVRSFGGATDFVNAVASTPDGALIAAGGQDGVLRLWNARTGQLIASFER